MDIRLKVGTRIKEIRQGQNLSQEKLALKSELDRTYMSSVENGRRNLSIISLEKLLNALGVTMKDFFNSEQFDK